MVWPGENGPAVISDLAIDTSADGAALPPLPLLSVLFEVFGSNSSAFALALLSNAPAASIVAVTVIDALAPEAIEAMVHGNAAQPAPLTLVMVRFDGVSVTCTFVAVDGPAFAMKSE